MKNTFTTIAKIAVFFLFIVLFGVEQSSAQFSKAVVILKGSVHNEQTGKAFPVKISIRTADEKNEEITNSQSNSVTGNYLVVLQCSKTYRIHLEGQGVTTKDEIIETPASTSTVQITKDFMISTANAPEISTERLPVR